MNNANQLCYSPLNQESYNFKVGDAHLNKLLFHYYKEYYPKSVTNDNLNKIIVTKGEQGAILGKITVIQTRQVEVRDVSGAGDTFLAGLVAKYTNSGDIIESIKFANQCAGEAVSHKGVVSVDLSI